MDEKKVREALESLKEEVQALKDLMREDEERRFFLINVYGEHEHLNIAIEALEKQLAMKITDTVITRFVHGTFEERACPRCGEPLDIGKYCSGCGQRLDWSE